MKKVIRYLSYATLLIVTLFIILTSFWFQYPQRNETTVVLIGKGSSVSHITQILAENKVLDFPLLFQGMLYATLSWRDLKAGEYLIPADVTPAHLMGILKSGNVVLHPVILIEGETSHSFAQKLQGDPKFKGDVGHLKEGTLLPETYHFPRGIERKAVLSRLEEEMNKAAQSVWQTRAQNSPLKSQDELIILASIVEKETRLSSERPIVAAVFLNRIRIGMPLQADPTVIYGLTKGEGELGRDLTLTDLQAETPHNTYLIQGLPPTPIANPSLETLKAVANPADVAYLYFVADGKGGHIFATTLEEHKKNHEAWRVIRDGARSP